MSLSITLHLLDDIAVTNYNISYHKTACSPDSYIVAGINGSKINFNVSDLHGNTEYFVRVTALMIDGEIEDDSFYTTTPLTGESGNKYQQSMT